MEEKLQELKVQVLEELATIGTVSALKDMKVKYLGKKGSLTEIMRGMGKLSPEERPIVGQMVNEIRGQLEATIEERSKELEKAELIAKLANEKIDITLPGRKPKEGHLHPVTLTLREMKKIFMRMGFDVMEGPEIENDYFNFEALNLPKDHPARDMQDTFYITEEFLLRTQTSPVQAPSGTLNNWTVFRFCAAAGRIVKVRAASAAVRICDRCMGYFWMTGFPWRSGHRRIPRLTEKIRTPGFRKMQNLYPPAARSRASHSSGDWK